MTSVAWRFKINVKTNEIKKISKPPSYIIHKKWCFNIGSYKKFKITARHDREGGHRI